MTHTYAVLEVSPEAYAEVRALLAKAGYGHTFHEGDRDYAEVIDMHGIALAVVQVPPAVQGDARRLPLSAPLLVALAFEVRTFGREPATWSVSTENLALRLEEAAAELERLREVEAGVREHRDARGDDRCHHDDTALYRLLPEGYEPPAMDTAVELEACRRFIACRQNPETAYVSPQREIERLRALCVAFDIDPDQRS